jgi:hypothetical protein
MGYLIDGSNLGGVLGGRQGSRSARRVVRWLLPWARSRRQVTVFFDGPPQPAVGTWYGPLEVVFAGALSADDLIIERVARRPIGTIVITDDAALARTCVDLGASLLAPAELYARQLHAEELERLLEDREKPSPTPADVAHWRRIFEPPDD